MLAVIIITGAGFWFLSNQNEASQQAPLSQLNTGAETQADTDATPVKQNNTNTPVARTYQHETSGTLTAVNSPSNTYAVMYSGKSDATFRIVETSSKKVLSDYKPQQGKAIICEMLCYPFAEWLDDSTLIIGSVTRDSDSMQRNSAVVFNAKAEIYRPATAAELVSFDLYNDVNLFSGGSNQ